MSDTMLRTSLGAAAAKNLADVTKTAPQMGAISPRWLVRTLPWVDVEAGLYRVNRVRVMGEELQRVETRVDGERALLQAESLRAIPLFSSLAPEVLADLAGGFDSRQFGKGAAIVNEGEPGNEMFIVCRGEVEVSSATPSGNRSVLARRREGDFFGEMALLGSAPRMAPVRAVTPTLVPVLTSDVLLALAERHPPAPRGPRERGPGPLDPGRAMHGDQASVDWLGRGASRRDPIAGLDPLPWGRDAVTYCSATVSTGREAGIHWPELVAFRLSDDFPASPFDPVSTAAHAADNAGPAAMFPAAAPDFPPPIRPPGQPTAQRLSEGVDMPAWLVAGGEDPSPWASPEVRPEGHPDDRTRRALGPIREPPHGIRGGFPALSQEVNGRPLVWLDSAATTQKPRAVIDAVSRFYERDNSKVHRGAHELAARATDAHEAARGKVQRFPGARSPREIIFVDGATEAINLVAQSWGRRNFKTGDVVLVSHLEHHSNIVPWIQVCEATGAVLRVIPVDDAGDFRLDAYEAMLESRIKVVAITHVSNALGIYSDDTDVARLLEALRSLAGNGLRRSAPVNAGAPR